MIIGAMVTLIVVIGVMIPIFGGLDDRLFETNENAGALHYASIYRAGDARIEILIDGTNNIATIGGETVQLHNNDVLAASTAVQIVYNQEGTEGYPNILMVYRNATHHDSVVYIELNSVQITTIGGTVAISMVTEIEGHDLSFAIPGPENTVYYVDPTGEYGIYGHDVLGAAGVSTNGRHLGVFVFGAQETGSRYGAVGTWNYHGGQFNTELYNTHGDRIEDLYIPTYETVPIPCEVFGSVTQGEGTADYITINVEHVEFEVITTGTTQGTTVYATSGFYLIAPIEYQIGIVPHAQILTTVLWLIPVLTVLVLLVAVARYMTDVRIPVISGNDRDKER